MLPNRYIFIIAAPLLLSASLAYATPQVTGVTGTAIQGQNIVISGSGFGTKSPVEPWMYDDFENSAVAGKAVSGRKSTIGGRSWANYDMSGGGGFHLYNNTYPYNGSYSSSESSNGNSNGLWVGGEATQTRYASFRFRYAGSLTGGYVWKFDRTTSGLKQGNSNPPYDAYPNFGWGNRDGGYYNNGSAFINYQGWPTYGSASVWHRIESYFTMSSKGVANGSMKVWVDNILSTNLNNNTLTCSSNVNVCQIDTWLTPVMANNTSPLQTWVDDVYIDNTIAHVEICNSETWTTDSICDVQIPNTTWNDNTIQVQVSLGQPQSSATTGYLYVIDSGGNRSNGLKVVLGKSVTPPANLKATPTP